MSRQIDPVRNFARVTVSTGYDASATTVVLDTGHGALLPDVDTEGIYNLVWWNSTDYPDLIDDPNMEIIRVQARSSDTLTIARGVETSAHTHNTGGKTYRMILALTAAQMNLIDSLLDTLFTDKVEIGGQLGGTVTAPTVIGITETAGPTGLTIGAVADGKFLKRVGTDIVGADGGGGAWDDTTLELVDDFLHGTFSSSASLYSFKLGWKYDSNPPALQYTAGRLGVVRLAATADHTTFYLSLATYGVFTYLPISKMRMCAAVISTGSVNHAVRMGWLNNVNPSPDPTEGVYFRATTNGNWFAVTRTGSAETATDTGVAVNGNYHRFEIDYNSTSEVKFYIDGVLKATHTAHITTTAGYTMPMFLVNSSSGAVQLDVDYFAVAITGISR